MERMSNPQRRLPACRAALPRRPFLCFVSYAPEPPAVRLSLAKLELVFLLIDIQLLRVS